LEHAEGAPPEELDKEELNLLCWCAGLLIGEGRSALPLLALVRRARCSSLDPKVVARHIFEAAMLSRDQDAAAWESIWPAARGPLEEFLPALEAQAGTPHLADHVLSRLKGMILLASTTWGRAIADLEPRGPDQQALREAQGRVDVLEATSARQAVDLEAARRMRREDNEEWLRRVENLARTGDRLQADLEAARRMRRKDNEEWLRRVENLARTGDRLQADLQSAETELRRRLEALEARRWVRIGRLLRALPPQSTD